MEDSTSSVWHAGRGAGRQKKEEDQLADEEGEDRHIGSQGPGPMCNGKKLFYPKKEKSGNQRSSKV